MRRSPEMGGVSALRPVGNGVGQVKEVVFASSGGGALVERAGSPQAPVVCFSSSSSSASPTSSPSFSSTYKAAAAANTVGGWNSHCDGEEWQRVGMEEVDEGGGDERLVFGTAPSEEEAEDAVSILQQIFIPVRFSQVTDDEFSHLVSDAINKKPSLSDSSEKVSSAELSSESESESDWIEPAMHVYTNSCSSRQREKVVDAFRLLQANPSLRRMVVSLSSDKDVWDAVMKNEVVQELKKSVSEAKDNEAENSSEHGTLTWFFHNMKTKFMEFVDKIMRLVNDNAFHYKEKNKNTNVLDDAVKTSFMLSVIAFIVIVVVRINKA